MYLPSTLRPVSHLTVLLFYPLALHKSNNVFCTRETSCWSGLTMQHMRAVRRETDPNALTGGVLINNIRQYTGHATLGEMYCSVKFTRRKILQRKLQCIPSSASDWSHTSKTTRVLNRLLQKENPKRWLRRTQESRTTGQWQIYLQ